MREILFRGKRTDNSEWIEGYYAVQSNHACFAHELKHQHFIFKDIFLDFNLGELQKFDVIPETVGQYTGLTDKNGKKIFEGDMIKPFDDEIDKMVVEFRIGQFLLCLYGERGYMAEYGWEESGNYGCFEAEPLSSYGDDIEVIGNIHDDPELLRGDANG